MRTDPLTTDLLPMPQLQSPAIPKIRANNPAKWMYERVAQQIQDFEKNLSSNEEIGLRLVATPDTSVMHINDVGYWGPDMLIFHGTNQHGKPMQLLQHYTQMSILLMAVPSQDEEPKRIGFHLVEKIAGE